MSERDPRDFSPELLEGDPDLIHLNADIWGGLFISLFGLVGWFAAGDGAFNVWVFPKTNSMIIIVLATAIVIEGVVRRKATPIMDKTNLVRLVLPMAGGLVLFYFLFTRLGWVLTTTLLFGLAIFALQPRKSFKSAAISFGLSGGLALFFFYVFGEVFYVPWPEGTWLEPLLGG